MTSPTQSLANELWLCSKLQDKRAAVFDGVTSFEERRERVRRAIAEGELAEAVIGRNKAGVNETYAACFQRLYGEAL